MQVTGVAGRCEVSWNPLRSNGGQCLPLSLSPPSISVITICMKGPHSFKSLYKFWKINVLQLASKTGLTTYQSCRFFSIYLVKNSCYIMLTHSASSKCILGGVWNQESVLFQNQFHWKKKPSNYFDDIHLYQCSSRSTFLCSYVQNRDRQEFYSMYRTTVKETSKHIQ